MTEPWTAKQPDVIVVGSGPAGLAAAIALKRAGVAHVVVLEREVTPGGNPLHCGHPPFGLREYRRVLTGPAYARRNVAAALAAGVDIRPGVTVTGLHPGGRLSVASPAGSTEITAQRILLATGIRETPRSARLVSGARGLGICTTGALQKMVYLANHVPFRNPVIVGGELVSFSSLLTARRAGIRPVAMLEEQPRARLRRPMALAAPLVASLAGVPLRLDTRLERIIGKDRVRAVTIRRGDGQIEELACDGVLFTGQFTPETSLARLGHLAVDTGTGGVAVDQVGRCSDPAYFAAGNGLRPVETAGWCWREGWRTGLEMAQDLVRIGPAPTGHIGLTCASPIRFVLPQRISLPAGSSAKLPLRLGFERPVRGDLLIKADGTVVAKRSVNTTADRNISITLPGEITTTAKDGLHLSIRERA